MKRVLLIFSPDLQVTVRQSSRLKQGAIISHHKPGGQGAIGTIAGHHVAANQENAPSRRRRRRPNRRFDSRHGTEEASHSSSLAE